MPTWPQWVCPEGLLGAELHMSSGDSEVKKTWFQGLYILMEKVSMVVNPNNVVQKIKFNSKGSSYKVLC